jgi:predicted CoA-binding protein
MAAKEAAMIEQSTVDGFLAQRRIAVVGASDDKQNFGGVVLRALLDHGYDAVGVNPHSTTAAGVPCWPDLASVPGPVDGVVVMVPAAASAEILKAAIARGVTHVWLFRGIGGHGAVTDEAVALCQEHHVSVIAGACPLMFLEPVGFGHRMHRTVRRVKGAVERRAKKVPA